MNDSNKGLILILPTAIISGFSVFINKFGVAMNNPDVFTFAKNTAVAVLLAAVILFFSGWKKFLVLKKEQWLKLSALGLVGGSIPFLLFFKGLAMTSAAQGAFIHKTMFIFVALLATIFLKEKLNKSFFIGGLLLLAGILLTLKSWNFVFGLGDGFILLAVLFWSAENILAKYLLRDISGNIVAWSRMFFGSALMFLYLMFTGQASQLLSLSLSQLGWIGITAILLLGYVITWYNGLKFIPVSLATTILLLGLPITTMLTALNNGKIAPQDILSGILILTGLIVIFGIETLKNKLLFAISYKL
jgi:drug/metabolite transporter (DMT)-like permease